MVAMLCLANRVRSSTRKLRICRSVFSNVITSLVAPCSTDLMIACAASISGLTK